VSFAEIQSWSRLMLVRLAPWEVRALRALDMAFLRAWQAAQRVSIA
jgi:hypothetical protein